MSQPKNSTVTSTQFSRKQSTFRWRNYILAMAILVEFAIFAAIKPEVFLRIQTINTIIGVQIPLIVLTLGLTVVLVIGEFDLSIGANLVLSNVLIAVLWANAGVPVLLAVLIALLAGLFVGLLNSLLVVRIGLNSFIATLGVSTVLTGLAQMLAGGTINSNIPDSLKAVVNTRVFGLPLMVFYALVLALILWYVIEHTPIGRYFRFVGGNLEVARLAGINTTRTRTIAFLCAGLIAAFAGVLQAGSLGSADPSAGASFLLPAFAAAFLGSTAVRIGLFNIWGTVLASYLLITGVTGLALLGLTGWVQDVFNGVALLIALIFARVTSKATK